MVEGSVSCAANIQSRGLCKQDGIRLSCLYVNDGAVDSCRVKSATVKGDSAMLTPSQQAEAVLDRLTEIIWWNWNLTRLSDPTLYRNHETFFRGALRQKNRLLQVEGPFIERVEPAELYDLTWDAFCSANAIEPEVREAVRTTLFGGQNLSLYRHQARTATLALSDTPRDVILSVPTAMGKTESFLIPILNYCLQENRRPNRRLKAIVLYPMKALESDQLGRFLKYLQVLNDLVLPQHQVTVGIWDGDTPERLARGRQDFGIRPGTPVRGLSCPKKEHAYAKLTVNRTGSLECEHGCIYPYVKTVRDDIRAGVDILITNHDALEYALLSNNDKQVKRLFGANPEERSVRYICLDEAHIWDGFDGAVFSLFIERLKHFFAHGNPRFILVSATVGNPKSLASRLIRSDRVETVEFVGRPPSVDPKATLGLELYPCRPEALFTALWAIARGEGSTAPEALANLEQMGLAEPQGPSWRLTAAGQAFVQVAEPPERPLAQVTEEELTQHLILLAERITFKEAWLKVLQLRAPAVLAILMGFSKKFVHYDEIVAELTPRLPASTDVHAYLSTMLTWVRLAGAYQDKYHVFIRPPFRIYWCPQCRWLNSQSNCERCGDAAYPLSFCDCHQPLLDLDQFGLEHFGRDSDLQAEAIIKSDERLLVPVGWSLDAALATYREGQQALACPTCGKLWSKSSSPRTTNVHYRSLTTYLTATLAGIVPSHKVLAFADSRASVETIATDIESQEYLLAVERMAVRILRGNHGTMSWHALQDALAEEFQELFHGEPYKEILRTFERDDDLEQARNSLSDRWDRLWARTRLANTTHLFRPAVIGPACLHGDSLRLDSLDHAIGQVMFTRVLDTFDFTVNKVKLERLGLPASMNGRSKGLLQRVQGELAGIPTDEVANRFDRLLRVLVEAGVFVEKPADEVVKVVESRAPNPDVANQVLRTLRVDGQHSHIYNTTIGRNALWELSLIHEATRCHRCLKVAAGRHDRCVYCGHRAVTTGSRSAAGYLLESGYPFPMDHWARETLGVVAADPEYTPHVVTAVHRAGLAVALRSAHEEGFRRGRFNIVGATPTMELGIDIGTLTCLVQVGIPPTLANYVQRAGRAGRARITASMVWTVIRNNHAVDNHFFGDLDRRFLNAPYRPNRIPEMEQVDAVLTGQMVAEVCVYLSRNDFVGYDRIYRPADSTQPIRTLLEATQHFRRMAVSRQQELEKHLTDVFRSIPTESIKQLFRNIFVENSGHLSIVRRTKEALEHLKSLSGIMEDELIAFCQEQFNVFPKWLAHLGLFTTDVGEAFPIARQDKTGTSVETKSSIHVLREAFPGSGNGPGALFAVASNRYQVIDVALDPEPMAKLHVCVNKDCDLPYKTYPEAVVECPFCHLALQHVTVHGMKSIKCRLYVGDDALETTAHTEAFGGA